MFVIYKTVLMEAGSFGGGILSLLGTFIVILLIIYASFRFSKYIGQKTNSFGQSKNIKVIDNIPIGQDRFISIVNVGKKYFLIGITSSEITFLKELSEDEIVLPDENITGTVSFKEAFMENIKNLKK